MLGVAVVVSVLRPPLLLAELLLPGGPLLPKLLSKLLLLLPELMLPGLLLPKLLLLSELLLLLEGLLLLVLGRVLLLQLDTSLHPGGAGWGERELLAATWLAAQGWSGLVLLDLAFHPLGRFGLYFLLVDLQGAQVRPLLVNGQDEVGLQGVDSFLCQVEAVLLEQVLPALPWQPGQVRVLHNVDSALARRQ